MLFNDKYKIRIYLGIDELSDTYYFRKASLYNGKRMYKMGQKRIKGALENGELLLDDLKQVRDTVFVLDDYNEILKYTKKPLKIKRKRTRMTALGVAGVLLVSCIANGFNKDEKENVTEINPPAQAVSYTEEESETVPVVEETVQVASDITTINKEDQSSSDKVTTVEMNYSESINKYAEMYGIDPLIIRAIICQENPYNQSYYDGAYAHGLMQIEDGIFGPNDTIVAFNHITGDYDRTTVDYNRIDTDPDYAIKIGTELFANNLAILISTYGEQFRDGDMITIAISSYNEGITATLNACEGTSDLSTVINRLNEHQGGTNDYAYGVLSYIEDGSTLTVSTKNYTLSTVLDNTTVNEFHK